MLISLLLLIMLWHFFFFTSEKSIDFELNDFSLAMYTIYLRPGASHSSSPGFLPFLLIENNNGECQKKHSCAEVITIINEVKN